MFIDFYRQFRVAWIWGLHHNSLVVSQGLMRELELREKKISDIQATGDRLIKDGHPGRKTVEVRVCLALDIFCSVLEFLCVFVYFICAFFLVPGFHCSLADPVELDPSTLLLY